MSFVNGTMMLLAYTANMIATLPEKVGSELGENTIDNTNLTTTTLSPEERENQFDFDDREYIGIFRYFINVELFIILKKGSVSLRNLDDNELISKNGK